MRHVLVLANNLKQASFRLRVEAMIPLLALRGFKLDVQLRPKGWLAGPKLRRILRTAGDYHAVLLQRKFLEPGDANTLRVHARRILYDVDDAVMYHNRPVGLVSRWRTIRRFHATARVLDHVIAGNEYLAEIFRGQGCRVSVVPTVVDPDHYQVKVHEPTETPRLVWIGSHSTIQYVQQFLPALEEAATRVPGLKLITIADATVTSGALPVEHVPWSRETEAANLCRGDIGIAPMPADPWTLGKCGFKIVQYMASGLPVVASSVGANAQLVRQGVTGFLPETTEQWAHAIETLAKDVQLRTTLGAAGRELARTDYSTTRAADEWAHFLNE
ncbi:MAG TPA: glycosyltransferase family 4 protein [Tepidisphaeraceae bacterium]|jgi:glycosyltransferase involved in cell wall biosynthesis|nr:glycosyltransferase family 4 protein [Tepidisphaeraceae bacterium]